MNEIRTGLEIKTWARLKILPTFFCVVRSHDQRMALRRISRYLILFSFVTITQIGSAYCEEIQKNSCRWILNPNQGFNGDLVKAGSSQTIESMMNSDGDVILFRVIGERYVKGKRGFYSSIEDDYYSYTLSPYLPWGISGDLWVIVSQQNIYKDKLVRPTGEYTPILPTLRVNEMCCLQEIKVKIHLERPLLVLRYVDFLQIRSALEARDNFTTGDFVNALISSEKAELH